MSHANIDNLEDKTVLPVDESPKLVIPLHWLDKFWARLEKLNPLGTFFWFRKKINYPDGSSKEIEIEIGPNVKKK